MLLVHLSYLGRLKQSRRLFFIRLVTQRRLHDFLMVLSACMFSSTVKHPPFRALEMALEMLAKASLAADAACRLPSSPSKASKQGRKASKQGRSFLKHDASSFHSAQKPPPRRRLRRNLRRLCPLLASRHLPVAAHFATPRKEVRL